MTDSTDDIESYCMMENTYCRKHPGLWPHECSCDVFVKIGDKVIFTGYKEDFPENDNNIKPGDIFVISNITSRSPWPYQVVTDDGKELLFAENEIERI